MQRSRRGIERTGVDQGKAPFPRGYRSQFWKPDVVADRDGDLAVGWEVQDCDFVSGR
jgi:hypothetical protein